VFQRELAIRRIETGERFGHGRNQEEP